MFDPRKILACKEKRGKRKKENSKERKRMVFYLISLVINGKTELQYFFFIIWFLVGK